ncbi:nucleotidyltransferase family protein [Achromobacter mucicolens]|uniref:nucleotidyltransferase family protein n=1 Tax=Achromobacter mucicolens TaxID=1389922 RepID=UPI000D351EC2|nr:nucleotidyltransferase family protein [Achromobacter mucicolens]PTW98694.1 nucleotidyltransferase family protein [Achromobacter mucicolens]
MFDLETNPDNAAPSRCVGILLAAGRGRRYAGAAAGQDKLLAPLADGVPVVVAAAASLRAATARVVAITRADNDRVAAALAHAGCEVVTTDPHADGMGDSLAAAARHVMQTAGGDIEACLVALGDMPWIRPDTCLRVAQAARRHLIVAPVWHGQRGHPVAFQRSIWPSLAALSGDVGARPVLARYGVTELAVEDAGVCADVDTPDDLAAARRDGGDPAGGQAGI